MSKPPPPAPTASAIGPCPTVIKIVGRPGTGSLPSTIAPPDHHPPPPPGNSVNYPGTFGLGFLCLHQRPMTGSICLVEY